MQNAEYLIRSTMPLRGWGLRLCISRIRKYEYYLDMIDDLIKELAEKSSVRFYVRARPSASKTKFIEKMADESLKIAIVAPAENGKANAELIKFLSKEFDVESKNVRIISGKKSRLKLIEVCL